jgi:transcriptional regulator
MQELPDTGIARRMKAIIGFDIEITALRGKVKLGQDEPRVDALAVASRLDASDAGADQKLAGWIREKNQ